MKTHQLKCLMVFGILVFGIDLWARVPYAPPSNSSSEKIVDAIAESKKSIKKQKKWERKRAKFQKKLSKFKRLAQTDFKDLVANNKIILGALLILLAILIGLLIWLNIFGSFFSWIASLSALAGVVLLVWGLVELL